MRNCIVCYSPRRIDHGLYQNGYNLHTCVDCGFKYLDAPGASQEALNNYYAGDTSPDLHTEEHIARITHLANRIRVLAPRRILDIGGEYCELAGIVGADTKGPNTPIHGTYDLIVISHCLEHVYDVQGLMLDIIDNIALGGTLIIEGPIWDNYHMPIDEYDHFWQHLNKFRTWDIAAIMDRFHFRHLRLFELYDVQTFHAARIEGKHENV